MKLARALLCVECDEIFEAAGPNNCPACGCGVAYPVERAINRAERTIPALRRNHHKNPARRGLYAGSRLR